MAHKSYDHLPKVDHKKSLLKSIESAAKKLVARVFDKPPHTHAHSTPPVELPRGFGTSCDPGLDEAVRAGQNPKPLVQKK